jgi:hypothetical protein
VKLPKKRRSQTKNDTARRAVASRAEAELLIASRHRCCLCVRLDNDYGRKKLQFAHIDRNRANSQLEDLAPVCQPHHDDYDSISRQTKAMKPRELRAYRDSWFHEASVRYPMPAAGVKPPASRKLIAALRSHQTFRVIRRTAAGDKLHETLDLHIHGSYLTVTSSDWISVGPLRGTWFVGRFKYHRGDSSKDHGTHDLTWNGSEFVGSAQFDYPLWGSADLVWRPLPSGRG